MSSITAAPSAADALARAPRARITSLASSSEPAESELGASGIGDRFAILIGQLLGRRTTNEHRADAISPPLGGLGRQLQTFELHLCSGDGDATEVLGQETTDGVDVIILEVDLEASRQL